MFCSWRIGSWHPRPRLPWFDFVGTWFVLAKDGRSSLSATAGRKGLHLTPITTQPPKKNPMVQKKARADCGHFDSRYLRKCKRMFVWWSGMWTKWERPVHVEYAARSLWETKESSLLAVQRTAVYAWRYLHIISHPSQKSSLQHSVLCDMLAWLSKCSTSRTLCDTTCAYRALYSESFICTCTAGY
jgi:hypothetical protein